MFARIIVLSLFALIFALYTSPVSAQTQAIPSYVSPISPLYTDLMVHNLFHSFSCLAVGQSVINQPCLSYLQGVPVLSRANTSGGVLGATTSIIGMLYTNPPVRTADYIGSLNFGAKEANAQVIGSGAAVLNPILKLWQVSRNISYVFMIIIFVIIGIMIMFRHKINPQTVITAQAALPGLVIGLIMITFSYFMAGLISDMAFVGTNVVGYYFTAAQGKLDSTDVEWKNQLNLSQKISGDSVLSIFSNFVGIVTRSKAENAVIAIFDKMSGDVQTNLRIFVGFISAQLLSPFTSAVPPPLGIWLGPLLSAIGGIEFATTPTFWLGFILSFIAMLALIYQMLKLLLRLISSYLTIIFLTITAPFQFLAASLPGRQGIATGWILNMLGNILIFPAVLAVFYFIAFILGSSSFKPDFPLKVSSLNQGQENTFISTVRAEEPSSEPNMIVGNTTFPLFGGLDLSFIKIILAFGALMALPGIPDIVVKSVGKVGQAGQILGQEISGGIRSGQSYLAQGQRAAGGQMGGWQNALGGQSLGGPVFDPTKTNAAGEIVGGIVYPRSEGLIQKGWTRLRRR